ncbi:SusD/RagB family nutrient-binding outer membrane lipoprotein [Taibaiella chishuiensis]|uniref:SusD-like starch-binding protein associating with outer membrane n=1 Tax=Taibaiella chishuiensis TaxID=1434707 RepID=A0A2P8DDH4_9BACT|nr:SusD/RagB family nutrient-binding outer membrane lipoprotein [Taibaiella chishuiensis]PSK95266.1 SusD-like starch-binding protein associating with outer membrane [Taibaiella chishuiensis]
MKKYTNNYLLLALVLLLGACRKDFKEINKNPNASVAARPESLLAPALYNVVNNNLNRALRLNNVLMQDHVPLSNNNDIGRYMIRPAESDFMWNNWYLQLNNFRDMYAKATDVNDTTLMGMALICDVWLSAQITDMFGDVPYFNAVKGKEGIYEPEFDRQQDIYTDLFKKLEAANTFLALNKALAAEKKAADPLYQGDPALWRKFGNALYLRLLMRVSGRAEMNVPATVKRIVETEVAQYPMMAANTESAVLRFTTTPPYTSEFYNYRDYDFNGAVSCSDFFISNLNQWKDPRLAVWATEASLGVYLGVPSGYAEGQVPEQMSTYLAALKNNPLLGNIMNYAELQFLLAEAALRGMISLPAQELYEKGVSSAITFWGKELPENYLQKDGVAWLADGTAAQRMEQVLLQKYYALFFTDFQQWSEYRRTGYPVLPRGAGVQNGGQMPARFKYPVYVQSVNGAHYNEAVSRMGGDDLNIKVWWNKP